MDAAHTNAQPDGVVASPLTRAWTVTFNAAPSYPLVAGGKVFVAAAESQPNVRALDVNTGATVWGPIAIGSSVLLAYDAGRVYTLDRNGHVSALAAGTGKRIWSTQLVAQTSYWSTPVAANGWLYANGLGVGGTTYGLDGATGTLKWTANTNAGSEGSVAVGGGMVYEAEACDEVSAYDAVTGTLAWFHQTGCSGGGGNTPAIYDNLLWVRDWALGNIILDTTGTPQGSFAADAPPAFHAGMVFYMSSNTLTAVDIETSTIKWSFNGDGALCSSAAIAGHNGQVFVGSSSGKLYELDEMTGQLRSSDDVGMPVSCGTEGISMAIAGGHLIVPVGNQLIAY
jgi:outer membrane protein assembly factor BamB